MSRQVRRRRGFLSRGLVVTEGTRTEPEYIDLLKRQFDGSVDVQTVGVGKDPLRIVTRARDKRNEERKLGEPYDWCCCVLDKDEHALLPAALELAAKEHIDVVVSNLKFEVWLLWHLMDHRETLTTRQLDTLAMKHKVLIGKHIHPDFPVSAYDAACRRAEEVDPGIETRRVGPDPSSAMPVLVRLMRGTSA